MLNSLIIFFENFELLSILSFFLILLSGLVISVNNPVYSIIFLISVFALTAFIFIFSGITFLAMTLIIVYLGAVCVLFLFVVMMLNIRMYEFRNRFNYFIVLIILLFFVCYNVENFDYYTEDYFLNMTKNFKSIFHNFIEDNFILFNTNLENKEIKNFSGFFNENINSIYVLGLVFYSFFCIQFILAGLILLIALIGSIFLTLESSFENKKQDLFIQLIKKKYI
jgi:NADH:ubiquinone oxidoreductase subunit 6 (subunit J)